jgi:hypothetical protein
LLADSISAEITVGQIAADLTFEVWNSGIGNIRYTITDISSLFWISPPSAISYGEHHRHTVHFETQNAQVGTYAETITIQSDDPNVRDATKTIRVNIKVDPLPPKLELVYGDDRVFTPTSVEGVNPRSNSFYLRNGGGGSFRFHVASDAGWVVASPGSGWCSAGQASTEIRLNFLTANMPVGTATAHLTITADGAQDSPQTRDVLLEIKPNIPKITLDPAILTPSAFIGSSPPSQTFSLRNGGGGIMEYTITDNANWLSVSPSSGTANRETDTIQVNYSTAGMAAGTHRAEITIHDPDALFFPDENPARNADAALESCEDRDGSMAAVPVGTVGQDAPAQMLDCGIPARNKELHSQ